MSHVPNFAKVDFADTPVSAGNGAAASWMTPEAIPVKPIYGEARAQDGKYPLELAGIG